MTSNLHKAFDHIEQLERHVAALNIKSGIAPWLTGAQMASMERLRHEACKAAGSRDQHTRTPPLTSEDLG